MGEAGGSVYRGALSTVIGAYIFVANKTSDVARGGVSDDLGTDEPDEYLKELARLNSESSLYHQFLTPGRQI